MDQTNQQTANNNNTSSVNSTNQMAQDYLVTQRIDTSAIPKSQVEKDLEMFTKAEEKLTSKTPDYIKATKPQRLNSLPKTPPTINDILRIKNPFRGE